MHKASRIIPYDEIKRNGCQWCLDNKNTKTFDVRKYYEGDDLTKLNKELKRDTPKRYMFCPYEKCPYNSEFEGYDDYEKWMKEREIIFSFEKIFGDKTQLFPKRVTVSYIDTF